MADEDEITWRLSDLGMDLLERAGLAGLYMALQAATEESRDLSPLFWKEEDLQPDSVTVRWTSPAKPGFVKLMEWAWQVYDGVLYLPAIHEERDLAAYQFRVPSHGGIMRTFLQHVNTQPKLESATRLVEIDEGKTITVSFEPPAARVDNPDRSINPKTKRLYKKKTASNRIRPHEDIDKLFSRSGRFRTKEVSLSNWVYPGIAGRYGGEGSWDGPATTALLLMLAPTVCLYRRLQGEGGNWVFVVPDIRDLLDFAMTRRRMYLNADFTDVASLGDAGMRFLAEYATRNPRKSLGSGCRVVAMGYVGYYQGQSIRKSVLDVPPDSCSVRRYRLLHRELKNTYVALKTDPPATPSAEKPKRGRKKPVDPTNANDEGPRASGFIKLPGARGRIADNLVSNRPWYTDLFIPLVWNLEETERERKKLGASLERAWFQAICYQRSKLMKLIAEDDMWDTKAEQVFVQAFWETLDSLYAQEAEAAKNRGGSAPVEKRWERLEGDIYRTLMQAKTRPLLRKAMATWFAKAGRRKSVGDYPAAIWRLIDHSEHRRKDHDLDWRKGRDLALLALASHRKKEDRESAAIQEKGA